MIGGVSGVRQDVIPFGLASGEHARMIGINVVGMKRRSFAQRDDHGGAQGLSQIFFGPGLSRSGLSATETEVGGDPVVAESSRSSEGEARTPSAIRVAPARLTDGR